MQGIIHVANIITTANLLFGASSIFLSMIGSHNYAAWIIFFSIAFDIADGKIARLSAGCLDFGKQLDSLADLTSFVIAPAVLMFNLEYPAFGLGRTIVCLTAIFCGTFRLARYNSEGETKIAQFFYGLPTPAFGAFCASFTLVIGRYNLPIQPQIISIVIAIFAVLMISRIKYPTFKNSCLFQWKYVPGFAIILLLILIAPEITVFIASLVYVLLMPFIANFVKPEKLTQLA